MALPFPVLMASRIQSFPIVGHRGAPQLVPPGNTIPSLQRALEVGAQMVEVDVRATQDDVLVIDHEAVRSLAGRETPLNKRTFAEWQEHAAEMGTPLPKLSEVFDLVRRTGAGLMLDFKEPGTEGLLARAIRRSGLPYDHLLVAGANETSRQILRGLDPRIPLSLSLGAGTVNAKMLADVDTDAVTWQFKMITPAVVKALRQREILVYGWTVNLSEEMRRLRYVCEVDGIITDAPDLLKTI